MRLIAKKKLKMGPTSTTVGALMELARDGGRKMLMDDLLDHVDELQEKIEGVRENQENKNEELYKQFNLIRKDVQHNLCISRRFAHNKNPELLKVSDSDAIKLLEKQG